MKKKFFVFLFLLVFSIAGIFRAEAWGWHFYGVNIKDIPNRIKQAVETAKQSEIIMQFKQLHDDYKDIVAVWNPFKESVTSLYGFVFETLHEKPISELLKTGDEIKEINKKLDARTKPNLNYKNAGQVNVAETREKNYDAWMKKHEEEYTKTLSVSNQAEETSNKLSDFTKNILADKSGNAYALAQKRVLLSVARNQSKNMATQLQAQSLITTIDGDILEQNIEDHNMLAAMEHDIHMPGSVDDQYHKLKAEKYRIKELPR